MAWMPNKILIVLCAIAAQISFSAQTQDQSQGSMQQSSQVVQQGQGTQQKATQGGQRSQSQQQGRKKRPRLQLTQQGQQLAKRKKFASANDISQIDSSNSESSKDIRQFHEVLNDLLTEFAYDVKSGQINGLKNLSIRRVSVSEALPKTYEQYVELLVSERIRENSKVRIINCIPCKTKSSVLSDGKLMITSPMTNLGKMDEAAQQLNVENFMDVILVYHTTHMVLAFSIFNTTSKEEVWSRTYNSETLRSRYQKLAIDMKQIEVANGKDEYVPEYKFMLGISGSQLPNVAGVARDKSFIGFHLRSAEKFDNRKYDFGLLTSAWINTSKLLNAYPSEGATTEETTTEYDGDPRPLPYKYVLGIHAILAKNFLGEVESYDRIRHGVHVAVGGILSTGYLAPSVRFGWDAYFGRRWVMTLSAQYITDSNILVGSEYQKAKGGTGGDLALSLNL